MQAAIPSTAQVKSAIQPRPPERRRFRDTGYDALPLHDDTGLRRHGAMNITDERQVEAALVIDMVQELLGASLMGDAALFSLWHERVISFLSLRRHAAHAAAAQIESALRIEVIARHMFGCGKRRGLQRELESLVTSLRRST